MTKENFILVLKIKELETEIALSFSCINKMSKIVKKGFCLISF
jgi:hypothetical protein